MNPKTLNRRHWLVVEVEVEVVVVVVVGVAAAAVSRGSGLGAGSKTTQTGDDFYQYFIIKLWIFYKGLNH